VTPAEVKVVLDALVSVNEPFCHVLTLNLIAIVLSAALIADPFAT